MVLSFWSCIFSVLLIPTNVYLWADLAVVLTAIQNIENVLFIAQTAQRCTVWWSISILVTGVEWVADNNI